MKAPKTGATNSLIAGLEKETAYGFTENDALTFTKSGSALLDFFAQAGAMREKPEKALELFQKAFGENRLYAIRILFYLRDVRGGQGERSLFRSALQWIGTDFPEVFEKIVEYVPEYGRWDDMFFDNVRVFSLIEKQLLNDVKSMTPSLLAKWMPTINSANANTVVKARFMAGRLNMKEPEYRKTLRDIRKKINIIESMMSAKKWDEINYSAVPSQAARIYRNCFKKHDEARYGEFIEKATSGEAKINAGTLYPYQIYKSVQSDYSKALEALWNQLPDYTQGKNALVVADVSGSMSGDPMAVSVSLALYFAERNVGQFKDYFITFSGNPQLQRIKGETLREKMRNLENADWGMNTDLEAVFNLILDTARANNVPVSEMPETIYIISDMEFDRCTYAGTNYQEIENMYAAFGYEKPNLVFWNVNASGNNMPVRKNENGVALVSGFSPVIFKIAVENKTPEEVMMDTINSERYININI